MNSNRMLRLTARQFLFVTVGFHAVILAALLLSHFLQSLPIQIMLFEYLDLIFSSVMFIALYYFRFAQIDFWKSFFSHEEHLAQKFLKFKYFVLRIQQRLEHNMVLYILCFLLFLLIAIVFLLLTSASALLFEVSWFMDLPSNSHLTKLVLFCLFLLSELAIIFIGWLISFEKKD